MYFLDPGQYISPPSSESACRQKRLSSVERDYHVSRDIVWCLGCGNLNKCENYRSVKLVKPPSLDRYCLDCFCQVVRGGHAFDFAGEVKLASPEDSCKIVVQACRSDDFPFLRAASSSSPFFFMYRCLFEVLGLILPLTAFQYAMLEHLNVAPSQLHPHSWAMVKAFEILCLFFNIRPSVLVFLFFFQMKLTGVGSLASHSTSSLTLLGSSRLMRICWPLSSLTQMSFAILRTISLRFKLFNEDLLTLVERVDKAILEQLSALLDTRAILSLLSESDPLAALDGIMGDFTWRPLVKQVGLTGGTVPPSTAAPVVGERDDGARPFGCKKLKAPMSLCALKQAARLMPCAGHPSIVHDDVVVVVTPIPPPPPVVLIQEVAPVAA
ncbi:hypothetical protein JHK84_031820 [Glycine max]|nr:hypothetical protein JHK86_031680 [Glycine max]KAG5146277.1 hypothetical protein JHK84_031820 [Glycine max]